METILKLNNFEMKVETLENQTLTTGEKSKVIKKFWTGLNLPKASFSGKSYTGGSSLSIKLKETPTEAQKEIFAAFKNLFKKGNFDSMVDAYEYKKNANIFAFGFIFIESEEGLYI